METLRNKNPIEQAKTRITVKGSETNHKAVVVVQDLERRFGDFTAVNRISFEVQAGEIFGFLGPNGAGKSTTIRILCGILAPSGGRGTVAGYDIWKEAEKIKAHIGYMSQKFSLYEDLTVEENLRFYSGIYNLPEENKAERQEWVLKMAGLSEHRKWRTSLLSGGWKQRLALGCAVLHQPPVLFLDEPTSGVDPMSRRRFWDLIYEMAGRGVTVFVTTHYMDEAEYCDRIALIYRGELIAIDTPEGLKKNWMKKEILECHCDRPQEALELLEQLPFVQEAALFGQGIHLLVEQANQAVPEIRRALLSGGCIIQRMAKIPPSLEDVFVSLIEARDRTGEPQREVRS